MAAAEAEGDKAEEEVKRQEHDVSIVLSYMDDEHEKAAIEVRPLARAPRSRANSDRSGRVRFWMIHPPSSPPRAR